MASPPRRARRLLAVAATAASVAALVAAPPADAASPATHLTRWSSTTSLAKGAHAGLAIKSGALTLGSGLRSTTYADPYGDKKSHAYSYGVWQSPWVSTGFTGKTLIPSWDATSIPAGTWIRVMARVKSGSTTSSWKTMANWGYGTGGVHRTSSSAQADSLAKVSTDTLVAASGKSFSHWQVKVWLLRPKGSTATPKVTSLQAVAASYATTSITTSKTTMTKAVELKVPRYSQMIHTGEYAQWGGGGEAWCSPTSTSMVLRYFTAGPKAADYSWSKHAESWVDHAARYTYDYRYQGTGNWPFNTAYASRYGLDAFVTRLASLRDAETFIKAGIPVVAAVAFAKGGLTGAPISSTPGHLLVIVGFQKDGKVIVNDPAAPKDATVRRVYARGQFEKAWLGGSGGAAYIIHPTSKALPASPGRW